MGGPVNDGRPVATRIASGVFRVEHDGRADLVYAAGDWLFWNGRVFHRPFVEEVHFGSTPDEAGRIWWDICWIWGPPEDHLQALLGTIGAARFVVGTGQPLRIPTF